MRQPTADETGGVHLLPEGGGEERPFSSQPRGLASGHKPSRSGCVRSAGAHCLKDCAESDRGRD
eukprot:768677-Hanusia_phi.AAC.8